MSIQQDKRKHRGPNTRLTPKSREFIETDSSSSSSSECQSESEEAIKISALPQTTRAAINTQTLSGAHMHMPLLTCLGSAGTLGSLGTFGGKGLRVKDGANAPPNGSSSTNSEINGGTNGGSSGCNSRSISNISGSFGVSVPDPGGSGGQCKDLEPMSPPPTLVHEVPLSPLREYEERQNLWVKIDLSLLSRVPATGLDERPRAALTDGEGSEGRDRERQGVRTGAAERDRQQKPEDREWLGLRERHRFTKAERQDEENEQLLPDGDRQGDKDRTAERDRQTEREDRDRLGPGERDGKMMMVRDRDKVCLGPGLLENPPVQEQSLPRLAGRTERGETESKHRRQAAGSVMVSTDKRTSKNKRKHKVGFKPTHLCFFFHLNPPFLPVSNPSV